MNKKALTPEQERDKEVTEAIVDFIGALKGALKGFSHLCEAGADYLEAKNRERFFHRGQYPMSPKPGTRTKEMPSKQVPPTKH